MAANNSAPKNTATVSTTTLDPNPTGTSASATVGVGEVANLALAKSVSPQTANVGERVTYTLTVTNDVSIGESGGAPIGLGTTGGVVTDTLPPGLQFVPPGSLHGDRWDRHLSPGPARAGQHRDGLVHRPRDVGRGRNERYEHGDHRERGDPAIRDVPRRCSALPDFNPADNIDPSTLNVNPEADLSLTKTASNTNPAVDDEVDYTLTASNAGPNDATGVTIVDSLPPGLDFIDASPGATTRTARSPATSVRSRTVVLPR